MGRNDGESKTIRSVENAFRILDELRERQQAGVTELSDAVGLSKGTIHHYLATLRQQGFVEKQNGKYRLGLRPLSYGGVAREREQVFQIGKESVDRLTETTGETVRLVVERNGYGITLYQSTRNDREEVQTHVGTREELSSTAAGKAMLAVMDDDRIEKIEQDRQIRQGNKTVDTADLRDEIADVRSYGIAFDDEGQFDGVRCVAIALTTDTDTLLGAISVTGPTERIDDERFHEDIPQALRNIAGVIEINTAYRGWME
jgi:DNA-binding IclR family transcriptional regulator